MAGVRRRKFARRPDRFLSYIFFYFLFSPSTAPPCILDKGWDTSVFFYEKIDKTPTPYKRFNDLSTITWLQWGWFSVSFSFPYRITSRREGFVEKKTCRILAPKNSLRFFGKNICRRNFKTEMDLCIETLDNF